MSDFNRFKLWIRHQFRAAPVSTTLVVVNVFTYLTAFFVTRPIWDFLSFSGSLAQPWTLLTYILYTPMGYQPLSIIFFYFICHMFWRFGGDLERSWGSPEFGLLVATTSLISSLSFVAGALLFGVGFSIVGLDEPLTAVLVGWCMRSPNLQLMLFGVFPVKSRHLGIAILVIAYLSNGPVGGLFALVGPLFGWWYTVRGRLFRGLRWRGWSRFSSDARFKLRRANPVSWYRRRKLRRELIVYADNMMGKNGDGDDDEDQRYH